MKPIRNAAKAIIIKDNQLLVLKCNDKGNEFYQLPGGGQNPEEDLSAALKRECLEEISSEVEVGDILFIREKFDGMGESDRHHVDFMFSCRLAEGTVCAPGSEPDAAQEAIEWLPIDQLDQYPLVPKTIIARLMSLNPTDSPIYLGVAD